MEGRSPSKGCGTPSFFGCSQTPASAHPLLCGRGNRGCGFTKHAFPPPLCKPFLTHLLLLVDLPRSLRGREKRHKAGMGSGLWVGKPAPPPRPPSHPCILPAVVTSPASLSLIASRDQCPSSCPQTWHPSPGWGRPSSQPHGRHVTVEAAQEASPGSRSQFREDGGFLGEAAGRGKEKREEKKLLMHIMSAELSMTN